MIWHIARINYQVQWRRLKLAFAEALQYFLSALFSIKQRALYHGCSAPRRYVWPSRKCSAHDAGLGGLMIRKQADAMLSRLLAISITPLRGAMEALMIFATSAGLAIAVR